MPTSSLQLTHCYADESIHEAFGFVVTAFVFADGAFEARLTDALRAVGLNVPCDEYKSSVRMDSAPRMREARDAILALVATRARVAAFVGPFCRRNLGKDSLQALQSVLVRNAVSREGLAVYFDNEVFPSEEEALRLHRLFHALRAVKLYPRENSKRRVGIQAADAVAHCVGQILKEALSGKPKFVDVGGEGTGFPPGTLVPLGWELLVQLRHALLTRPVVYDGSDYAPECDPVVLDPENDDLVAFAQHPVLLGWGVQVAPDANENLRMAVENALGRVWLGCIH